MRPTGSAGREVSLEYNLRSGSFYCHWFVHYNILTVMVIAMASFDLSAPEELMKMLFGLYTSAEQHSEKMLSNADTRCNQSMLLQSSVSLIAVSRGYISSALRFDCIFLHERKQTQVGRRNLSEHLSLKRNVMNRNHQGAAFLPLTPQPSAKSGHNHVI